MSKDEKELEKEVEEGPWSHLGSSLTQLPTGSQPQKYGESSKKRWSLDEHDKWDR